MEEGLQTENNRGLLLVGRHALVADAVAAIAPEHHPALFSRLHPIGLSPEGLLFPGKLHCKRRHGATQTHITVIELPVQPDDIAPVHHRTEIIPAGSNPAHTGVGVEAQRPQQCNKGAVELEAVAAPVMLHDFFIQMLRGDDHGLFIVAAIQIFKGDGALVGIHQPIQRLPGQRPGTIVTDALQVALRIRQGIIAEFKHGLSRPFQIRYRGQISPLLYTPTGEKSTIFRKI